MAGRRDGYTRAVGALTALVGLVALIACGAPGGPGRQWHAHGRRDAKPGGAVDSIGDRAAEWRGIVRHGAYR